jgi:hypothetical protein
VNNKKIGVEPLSYGMTGFRIEDLFSKEFMAKLKEEFPTSLVAHFCIGFADSKNIVAVSYDRIEGKFVLDRVNIEGDGPDTEQNIKRVVGILKRVLT